MLRSGNIIKYRGFIPLLDRNVFRVVISLLVLVKLAAGCSKKEEEAVLIPGNTAPPDRTLPASITANYITKLYIGVLGRKPEASEYEAAKSRLDAAGFDKASRGEVVSTVLADEGFYYREYDLWNADLLNGTDTFQVNDNINTLQYLLTLPAYEYLWPYINMELPRLYRLKTIPDDLKSGTLSIKGMQRRCIDNAVYDEINMGSLNFVISSFQHFLLRSPTAHEQSEGVRIVDGFNGVLFLQVADSKQKYMDIFFDSPEYYEGQVKILFYRFLFRLPGSEEMAYYTQLYRSNGDYKALIRELLITDEYAGVK